MKKAPLNNSSPKLLLLDIETTPIISYTWGTFKQDIALNQIKEDWKILSFAAKWLDSKNIIFTDMRNKRMIKTIWILLNECDILITHNGKRFDQKRLNAQFILNGFQPPASYKHIDTLEIAKAKFDFTSNKLEYLSQKLCSHKKDKHAKFPGFDLWKECLNGNPQAFHELKKYNTKDILALEDLYKKLYPWYAKINFNLYRNDTINTCQCGSTKFKKKGFALTETGRYQRYKCAKCGAETRDGINLLSKEKRRTIKKCISG